MSDLPAWRDLPLNDAYQRVSSSTDLSKSSASLPTNGHVAAWPCWQAVHDNDSPLKSSASLPTNVRLHAPHKLRTSKNVKCAPLLANASLTPTLTFTSFSALTGQHEDRLFTLRWTHGTHSSSRRCSAVDEDELQSVRHRRAEHFRELLLLDDGGHRFRLHEAAQALERGPAAGVRVGRRRHRRPCYGQAARQ